MFGPDACCREEHVPVGPVLCQPTLELEMFPARQRTALGHLQGLPPLLVLQNIPLQMLSRICD